MSKSSPCTSEGIFPLFIFNLPFRKTDAQGLAAQSTRLICSYVNLTKQTEWTSREQISERGEEMVKNTKR